MRTESHVPLLLLAFFVSLKENDLNKESLCACVCVAAEWEDEGASDQGERDEGIEQLGLGGVAGP